MLSAVKEYIMGKIQYTGDDIICPACRSTEVEEISESEKIYSMGLYAIYDFIGNINKVSNQYRCLNCRHEW